MASSNEQFTLLGRSRCSNVFEDFEDSGSAKRTDPILMLLASIRYHHPDKTVSLTTANNVNLRLFASAGFATAEIDSTDDSFVRSQYYYYPQSKDDPGRLVDGYEFVRYKYTWNKLEFILYVVPMGYYTMQFCLFPPDSDETVLSNSKFTNALLVAAGQAEYPYQEGLYVFDIYWYKSPDLWKEVQKTSWKDVILDEKKKESLTKDIEEFFDNESNYKDLDVPWKRGIIFHGPPGNGKTLSLRALTHALTIRKHPINVLYVKSIGYAYYMRSVFVFARKYAPCILIIEDIDSLVTNNLQSYFFNEVDGLENNDGILMIATTNHLERLDGGIANRPSRFDRKYEFSNPTEAERVLYCDFWRKKLSEKPVEFPEKLNEKIAGITDGFSFAYMKEAFVSTLLVLARAEKDGGGHDDDDDISHLPLWVEIQKQVKILRKEMEAKPPKEGTDMEIQIEKGWKCVGESMSFLDPHSTAGMTRPTVTMPRPPIFNPSRDQTRPAISMNRPPVFHSFPEPAQSGLQPLSSRPVGARSPEEVFDGLGMSGMWNQPPGSLHGRTHGDGIGRLGQVSGLESVLNNPEGIQGLPGFHYGEAAGGGLHGGVEDKL